MDDFDSDKQEKPVQSVAEALLEFYKRDNEELRKFLTAERVENNSLRAQYTAVQHALGVAIGYIEGIRPFMAATTFAEKEWEDDDNVNIINRINALAERRAPVAKEIKQS